MVKARFELSLCLGFCREKPSLERTRPLISRGFGVSKSILGGPRSAGNLHENEDQFLDGLTALLHGEEDAAFGDSGGQEVHKPTQSAGPT